MLGARLLLALAVLFPPAFLMGGTFPVLGQLRIRSAAELGRVGASLYGINTAGAILGAAAAGFWLPRALGFDGAYAVALAVSAGVGAVAVRASRPAGAAETEPARVKPETAAAVSPTGAALAFLSGLLALALEVAWIRMFAQVLQNSVYTFATVLVLFLTGLALGAGLANRLARRELPPVPVLGALLLAAGIATAATPFLFDAATGGLGYVGAGRSWSAYMAAVLATAIAVLAVPATLVGAIFPYLLRFEEREGVAPGSAIGALVAWNTSGAILGSAGAGFLLLPLLGLWGTHRLLAAAYLLATLAVAARLGRRAHSEGTVGGRGLAVAAAGGLLGLLTVADPTALPVVGLSPEEGERVLEVREGPYGVVAVVEDDRSRRIKVNNYYSLGGTGSAEHERNQALLPLMLHPEPDSVFFLGLGTGITAGAALHHPVKRLVVAELVPGVVRAAERHFRSHTNGLFEDPRAEVVAEDGRNHLAGLPDRYDVIVSDLFVPWKAGVGSLYSLEHFRTVRSRLRPGGIFVQWLPLYQLTRGEFEIVARTLLEAFPEVLVWRGDFFATRPILALVAAEAGLRLDPDAIERGGRRFARRPDLPGYVFDAVTLPFYAGNLGRSRSLIPPGPLNTDDRPFIEYLAPVSHRRARAGEAEWFVGRELVTFLEELHRRVPPDEDPFLARLTAEQRRYVRAGLAYHRGSVLRHEGRERAARREFRRFLDHLPVDFRPEIRGEDAYSEVSE